MPILLLARWWAGHSFKPRWLSCQRTRVHTLLQRHAHSLRHVDKSFLTCNSNTHTSSPRIYQLMNCSELNTREGQLKMHWELEKQASTGFSQGKLRQRFRWQRDRETQRHRQRDRQERYRDVSKGSCTCSDTLVQHLTDTPHYTHKETHTQTHYGMILLLVPLLYSELQ